MATTTHKQRLEVQFMFLSAVFLSLVLIALTQFSIAAPLADCDGDGFDDAEEIAMGMESDYNENGIPDACEPAAYAVVPEEFATIQLAVDGAGGRVILISEGVYEGSNQINGVFRDLRARSWAAPPVLTTGIASGVALNVNNATLRMTGVVVESSLGAIQANSGSVVVLYSCVLDDNAQAVSLMGAQLTAFDTQFTGNTGNGGGGAAINASSSQLSLIQCDFVGNGGNTSAWNARSEGGAIRMTGNSGSELLASECLFSQNSATVQHDQIDSEFGASAYGGAIYATELHDTLVLDNCIFSGNRSVAALAETPAGSPAENVAEGGALYFGWVEGNVIIQQCTFKDNVVEVLRPDITAGVQVQAADVYLRGGVAANEIVFENTSFFDSEGLYRLMDGTTGSSSGCTSVTLYCGDALILQDVEMSNTARGGFVHWELLCASTTTVDQSTFSNAGTIKLGGSNGTTVMNSSFTETALTLSGDVANCSFQGTPAETGWSPAVSLYGSNRIISDSSFHQISGDAVISGGLPSSPLLISGSTICGNAASAFDNSSSWTDGGNNMFEGGVGGVTPCPSGTLRVVGGQYNTIGSAVAAAMNDDTIMLNPGIYNESVDLRGFDSITITGLSLESSSIVAPAGQPGIQVSTGIVNIEHLAVHNSSPGIEASGGVTFVNDILLKGNASTCGGAMHLTGDAYAKVQNSFLFSNSSTGNGGAICLQDQSTFIIRDSEIQTNTAQGNGGGIHADDDIGGFAMDSCIVSTNVAFIDGGGVSIDKSATYFFEDSQFLSNSAGGSGGGVSVVQSIFDTCMFLNNTANAVGGGLRLKGIGIVNTCQFQANVAGVGGGLAASAIETIVRDFVACGNLGGDWYGNVIDDDGVALFCSTDCNGNGVDDAAEIASGDAEDCNENSIPDECEDLADLDNNGIPDACDPTEGGALVFSDVQTIGGYPSSVNDILLRPLFRDGEKTMDILLLDPAEDGAILTIDPDATKGLLDGEYLGGASFERCCTGGATPACLNNGPAGGASLAWARGDIVLPHADGDTGLFDESFEMYFGCATGSGVGDPESITDYDLAPDSALVKSLFHLQLPEDGLAEAGVSTTKIGSHVLIALPLSNGGAPPATSGRRGSGTGGTGPYPGVDQIDSFSTSFEAMDLADFDGDGHDDMVLMHSTIDRISIRNFTGLADYIDEESGENVPSGATWTAPTWIWLGWTPVAMVAGDFIDLPGVADDDLSDIVFVRGDLKDNRLVLMAATGPNSFVQIAGDAWAGGDAPFALSTTKVDLLGNEVAVLACGPSDGVVSLRAFWYDQVNEQTESQSIPLQQGDVVGISTAPKRFGASPRESIGVLVNTGAQTVVHVVELSLRPHVVPLVADINGDGVVDGADLAMLLGGWGTQGASDINNDGTTNGADLAMLLGAWTG